LIRGVDMNGKTRIILNGAGGRMGREIMRLLSDGFRNCTLVAVVDARGLEAVPYPAFTSISDCDVEADCIIDFSHHSATGALMAYAVEKGLPAVVATTGQTDEELQIIADASKKIPIFRAANMSVGVALLIELAKQAAAAFPEADIEIVEAHHNQKLDVPSGTALAIANAICEVREDAELVVGRHENGKRRPEEIGIHSLRMGNVVGVHEIMINTGSQILTLKHEAVSRSLFAEGAPVAAEWLVGQTAGLYGMSDMLEK